jgi:hypothetical protein
VIFFVGSIAFLGAILAVRPSWRRTLAVFGICTGIMAIIADWWFWSAAMDHGWWFPAVPIVEQFKRVDGEGAYDAAVADIFILLWSLQIASFLLWFAVRSYRHEIHHLASSRLCCINPQHRILSRGAQFLPAPVSERYIAGGIRFSSKSSGRS